MAKEEGRNSESGKGRDTKVREVMTPNPQVVTRKESIHEVARLMLEHDCGAIPVVDSEASGKVVGMITDRDIVIRIVAKGKDVKSSSVGDAMTKSAHTVRDDENLDAVFKIMSREQVRRVPVVDASDKVVGIVAVADVATETNQDIKIADTVQEISEGGTSKI